MSTIPVYIYSLSDPTDSEIRYIGKTSKPSARLMSHIKNSYSKRTYKDKWIQKLLADGKYPKLTILEETDKIKWEEREKHWIAYGKKQGWRLTNATEGGEGSFGRTITPETRKRMEESRERNRNAVKFTDIGEDIMDIIVQDFRDPHFDALDYIKNNVSPLTYNNYAPSIEGFREWALLNTSKGENPAAVIAGYKNALLESGLSKKTVNKKLSALRSYFEAQVILGHLQPATLQLIKQVPNYKTQGSAYGKRLTWEQAHQLINLPDKTTAIGRRDRLVLALLIGCGLRRSEVAGLTWDQIHHNGKVWLIINLLGKHARTRTVAVPDWAKRIMDEYSERRISKERILVSFTPDGEGERSSLTSQTVWNIVKKYSKMLGVEVAPHDLRRTFAAIARQTAGVEGMTQLQKALGHSSISTTEKYIGEEDNYDMQANFIPDMD